MSDRQRFENRPQPQDWQGGGLVYRRHIEGQIRSESQDAAVDAEAEHYGRVHSFGTKVLELIHGEKRWASYDVLRIAGEMGLLK